ncbi:MAG: flagellar biosynthetic protein FliR [Candidatus Sumerlaeota bacterium]|nr:flagellar biosynthetic protein FliR [Candidatus Sumerlaeota bacterium]
MTTLTLPLAPLLAAIVILVRVGFLVAFMPLFGESSTPAQVRVLLAVALTMILAPLGMVDAASIPFSVPALIVGLLPEALVGLTLAMIGRLLFGAIQFAGELAGREMGFAAANDLDPTSQTQVATVAQLQYALAVLIFFATGAHAIFFQALAESFRLIPPFGARAGGPLMQLMSDAAARMFYLALKLNFPVIGALICVNATFAMLAKAVPQLNILMESFPIRIMAGLVILSVCATLFAAMVSESFSDMGRQAFAAIHAMAP